MLFAGTATLNAGNIKSKIYFAIENEFKKSPDGIWKGKNNTFYKLDKDLSLLSSADAKTWEKSKEQMWQDKDNYWYKIEGKNFLCSKDATKWNPGKNSKGENANWEAEDGMWCKFDSNLTLWIKKAGN